MRRTSILIGICVIAAMVVTLYAQSRDIQPVMKEVQPAFVNLGKNMQANPADAQKDAEKQPHSRILVRIELQRPIFGKTENCHARTVTPC